MAKVNLENLKMEVASELGITVGADKTARENGKVGGKMVRRLIEAGESNLKG